MHLPPELKYTESHEWVRLEADGTVVVGITDHAQQELGDIVFVGDVKVGAQLKARDAAAVVESVKAASDIYAPVAGEIVAFNASLDSEPQRINESPYEAWIFKLRPADAGDVAKLMDAAGYAAVAGQE
ncbi:MAG: glycine cleavage system protein GcvH [Betaproteobacteria bacterium]|nr:glycine cleavage system protein GcvH [Betaproteobacteria bacterium]